MYHTKGMTLEKGHNLQMKQALLHSGKEGQEVSEHPTECLPAHALKHWDSFLFLTFVLCHQEGDWKQPEHVHGLDSAQIHVQSPIAKECTRGEKFKQYKINLEQQNNRVKIVNFSYTIEPLFNYISTLNNFLL